MKRAVAFSLLVALLASTAGWAQTPPPPAPEAPPPEAPPPEKAPAPSTATPAVAPPPPKAAAAPAVPLKRPRLDQAVVQVLDKVTANSVRLTLFVGQTAAYKSLIFTVRACETNAADEPRAEASAYLVIDSQPTSMGRKTAPKTVFRGWMYASSPSLAPFEHPVYDVWMIGCKSSLPTPLTPAPLSPPPPPKPVPVSPAGTLPRPGATNPSPASSAPGSRAATPSATPVSGAPTPAQ
ncbi:MAG: hypothetical protein JWM33_1422 [Caulobacteraceae bacterium]|nr:hypothetical protein [Caulobacteraceae bacterium]